MACRNVHHSLVNVGYSMNFTEYGVLMYLLVINDVVIITNINIINIYIQKVINYPPDLLPFSSFSSSVFSRISFLFVVQFSYKFFWPEWIIRLRILRTSPLMSTLLPNRTTNVSIFSTRDIITSEQTYLYVKSITKLLWPIIIVLILSTLLWLIKSWITSPSSLNRTTHTFLSKFWTFLVFSMLTL